MDKNPLQQSDLTNSFSPSYQRVVWDIFVIYFLAVLLVTINLNLMTISPDDLFEKYTNAEYAIIGSDMSGDSLQNLQINLDTGWILILGNEAHGIHDSLKSYITHNISIPGFGGMESLNVAVAGGILLHGLTELKMPLQTEKKLF